MFGKADFRAMADATPTLSQNAADRLAEMERRNAEADRRDREDLARIAAELRETRERIPVVLPPDSTRLERVPYDDLAFPDWDHGYTYNEDSFTGIAYELYPNGQLRCEVEFRGGIQEGLSREWHPNGVLARESHLARGVWHGQCREWHPNGQLALDGDYEYRICVRRRRWDESGHIIEEFAIGPEHVDWELLGIHRRMYGGLHESVIR
ncbi:MAG: hypothetical protein U0791_17505 [Gemmataceae bacterium]